LAKLKTLKPLVGKMAPRLGYQSGNEQQRSRFRDQTQEWRAWYKTARWQKLRWSILVRGCFTCVMCGHIGNQTSQLVADHITPHRGDEGLFWDENNLQVLCKQCHDSAKAKQERQDGHR